MLSCRDATELISQSMDRSLPFGKRVGVRLHLVMCRFCSRYERQLLLIRDTMRHLVASQKETIGGDGEDLSPEARKRIRESLDDL